MFVLGRYVATFEINAVERRELPYILIISLVEVCHGESALNPLLCASCGQMQHILRCHIEGMGVTYQCKQKKKN